MFPLVFHFIPLIFAQTLLFFFFSRASPVIYNVHRGIICHRFMHNITPDINAARSIYGGIAVNTFDMISLKILRPFSILVHSIKVWFRNLKFHWKLQILILFPTLISYFAALTFYDYSLNLYDRQLYEDSATILSLSTQNIENEMQNLLNLTSQLSTDEMIQDTIRDMESSSTEYEEYTNRQKLMNRIYTSLNTRKYILSVTFIDPELRIDTVGSDTSVLLEGQAQQLYDIAFSKSGKASWITDSGTLLVCPVREVKNLSLRSMGAIVIRIQIDKLVQFTMDTSRLSENFLIYGSSDEILYQSGELTELPVQIISEKSDYTVADINGISSLIVRHNSRYSDWTYFYAIPNETIFSSFTKIRTVVFLLLSGLYLLLTAASLALSRSITLPLKSLANQMEHVQDIDFEASNLSFSPNSRKDEIGMLQQSYQFMIKKIEELIQKNYRDQLLLQDTKYRVLQAQINPHFIYNTLDSVYWLAVNSHQHEISKIIFSLGRLLRENMRKDAASVPLITFRQELLILKYYIDIQQIRFHEKLEFHTDISEDAMDCTVPRMLLQPLVENSISYGAEQTAGICRIILSARVENRRFFLKLEDNGIGVENNLLDKLKTGERKPKGHGIGLSNIEQRLQLIYGKDYHFSIKSIHPTGTLVTIEFPIDCDYCLNN